MSLTSAGLLLYHGRGPDLRVLLAHPGGPFWRNRDAGAWTIPKGLLEDGEAADTAARREFAEELGPPPPGALQALGRIRQRSGKWVEGFALEGDFDVTQMRSNTFEVEWPPHSGRIGTFPEIDRARWFDLGEARRRILPGQAPFLDRLVELLG